MGGVQFPPSEALGPRGPGWLEPNAHSTQGVELRQFSYYLFQEPQFWISDSANAIGVTSGTGQGQLTNRADWTPFTFTNGAGQATAVAQGNNVGQRLPYAVTPCIRYYAAGTWTQVLQVRMTGLNQWGEEIVETTPPITMVNPGGGAAGHTYYIWMSRCFAEVTKIEYKLANKQAADTLGIGIVHPLNVAEPGFPIAPTASGGTQTASQLEAAASTVPNIWNYGLGAPFRFRGEWKYDAPLTAPDGDFNGGFEILGGILQADTVAAGALRGTTAAQGAIFSALTDGSPDVLAVDNKKTYLINPFDPNAAASAVTNPLKGPIGGFTIGQVDNNSARAGLWSRDPYKFGLASATFVSPPANLQIAPLRQIDWFAGEAWFAGYTRPSVLNNYWLHMTFRQQVGQIPFGNYTYPTKGF
jgi:hypothetical protein